MSTQHTPGPWHTNGYSSPITGAITVYHKPFGLGDVAEVHDIADASLIAAAPELLAALQAMLHDDDHDEACTKARAAIAKATGEPT